MLLIAYIFGDQRLFFNQIILAIILIGQVYELVRYINKTNRELAKFILAIKHSDFSISFSKSKIGASFDELNTSFEEIIDLYKKAKIEKEAQFQYLRNVVSHINIGIISIEDESDITLMNRNADQLLKVNGIRNWQILKEKRPQFTSLVEEMGSEGRRLIELNINNEIHTLSLDISSLVLLDKTYKLLTFQDIRSEIEEKEIEAWHKLIRILTHEIMNSATPISSLTETMQMMLEKNELTEETIEDLRFSLKTIQKRSDGMLAFIDDYRKITKVPKPVFEMVDLPDLLKAIKMLTKADMAKENITLEVVLSDNIEVKLDPKLAEQILLNLIANATWALKKVSDKRIELTAYQEGNFFVIAVKDNGQGIPEKQLKEIFVPFFSTKPQGSGIGLSLTKQIMHLHHGFIKVDSVPGEGTTFYLHFPKSV